MIRFPAAQAPVVRLRVGLAVITSTGTARQRC